MAHTDTTTPDTTPAPPPTATAEPAAQQERTATAEPAAGREQRPLDELVEDDLLVEDVSIDGMCGVY